MKRRISFTLAIRFLLIGTLAMFCSPLIAQKGIDNLSLNKPAEQSSTYGFGVASIAVDGDTDGTRGPWGNNPSIQHTQNEFQPWWQVDLGASEDIRTVKIYNRTDVVALQERLWDVWLFISETPFETTQSLEDLKANPSIDKAFFKGRAGSELEFSLPTIGR